MTCRLTPARLELLMKIHAAEGIAQRELTRVLGVTPPVLTRMLEALDRLGLVVRRPCGHDQRAKVLALTPEGRRRVEQALDAVMVWCAPG
jgi:DNA-binding MarR family transcriptional regulator